MKTTITLLFVLIFASSIFAQTSGVDLSFNAVPDKNVTTTTNFILQPDDKVVAFGDFQAVRGVVKNRIARINSDGNVDNTFNCTICDFLITSVVAQSDGKIIIAGGAGGNSLNGQSRLFRLNADGSLDPSFSSPFPAVTYPESNAADVRAVQPDGKILVVLIRRYNTTGSPYSYTLNRLNIDGSLDGTFTPILIASGVGGNFGQSPGKVTVLPNGKILAVTNSFAGCPGCTPGTGVVKRYNADGTIDSTFEPPGATVPSNSGSSGGYIADFGLQADGSLIIVGSFTAVNGVNRAKIAKIQAAGNVDLSFNTSLNLEFTRVVVQTDGRILLGTANRIYRLNADSSLDNSFASPANVTSIYNFALDSTGKIILHALFSDNGVPVNKFARLDQNGNLETSFEPNFGVSGSTTAIAAQPDGKVVFSGDFIRVNGVVKRSLVRVNTDGSLDTTFISQTTFNTPASKILIQPDGKILIAGGNLNYNNVARFGLIRLDSNGSLDTGFNPTLGTGSSISVSSLILQSDGKILFGGNFNTVNGEIRPGIARLNADGTLDVDFNPTFGNLTIRSILVQSDGKVLVGGTFSGVNGFSRANLVRLNADGSLDNSFNAGSIQSVAQVEVQSNGKYLILTNTIVRLNSDGTTDTTFTSPSLSGLIYQFLAQPDGSILLGGSFTQINNVGRGYFARLKPNGTLDSNFFPTGANNVVRTIVRLNDGRILVGGDFSVIGGVTRLGIARLNVTPFRLITPYDFDGDGRADVAVFRPSTGNWFVLPSQTNGFYGFPFGASTDLIAPADYDGDGKTDVAVFRDTVPGAGDKAYFYILNSSDGSFRAAQFGTQGDLPMSGDWDGDGKADLAVYRVPQGASGSTIYYRPSGQPTVDYVTIRFGATGDKPLLGDFDGDGRLDPAVFRPSSASWIILRSSVNQIATTAFGLSTDIPVPADYDGDGVTNIAVFRPSTGYWYTSQNAAANYGAIQFGANGDLPVPADYDGDGRADVAVFRPTNGAWYINRTTSGFYGVQFGVSGDKPAPNAFIR